MKQKLHDNLLSLKLTKMKRSMRPTNLYVKFFKEKSKKILKKLDSYDQIMKKTCGIIK